MVAEIALGESNVNGRGSGIERKIQGAARERWLQIGDRRRHLARREGHRDGCCRSNGYVRGGAKSATGVRYVCGGMNVRNLNRRAENQQQGTAKSKGELPVPHVIFCLLIAHHCYYNLPFTPEGEGVLVGSKGTQCTAFLALRRLIPRIGLTAGEY